MSESKLINKNIDSKTCKTTEELVPRIEADLREHISNERRREMDRYGRTRAYDQIQKFLQGDEQIAFSLINHALAIVDDKIDVNGNRGQLNRAVVILGEGFQGKEIETTETWESDVLKLGQTLSRLGESGFVHATNLFNEVINYWEIESQNIDRKGKVFNSHDLDSLNLEIGKSVGMQFLYLLCPELDGDLIESVASLYGLSIKLADNLSDLNEDLKEGYVNISSEDIEKYGLNILDLNEGDFQLYTRTEFARLKHYYEEADEIVEKIIKEQPSQQKGILFFKEIAHSWLKQVSEVCASEHLRQFDIANYATPKFLSTKELLELENFYSVRLSDIIALSYEQESKNTRMVREEIPFYDPYFHEKTPQAIEVIKKLINEYPEIIDVLDLGCGDGSKTAELFEGKKYTGSSL